MSNKHFAVLASLFAVTAFAVMPALAQAGGPELGRCIKKALAGGAGYSNATCTTTTSGSTAKYEWQPGPGSKPSFTSTEGLSTFEYRPEELVVEKSPLRVSVDDRAF